MTLKMLILPCKDTHYFAIGQKNEAQKPVIFCLFPLEYQKDIVLLYENVVKK
jgi:hypothetical protein